MNYKGLYVWFNTMNNNWVVQVGYDVLASYETLSAAKSAITQKWSKLI